MTSNDPLKELEERLALLKGKDPRAYAQLLESLDQTLQSIEELTDVA